MADVTSKLRSILSMYPSIKLVYLFGSHVRGGETPLSDVDVAITSDDPSIFLDISAEISKLLNIPGNRVSTANLKLLDPRLVLKMVSEGVKIVDRVVDIHMLIPSKVVEAREPGTLLHA